MLTFDEWDACVAGGGSKNHRPPDGGWGRGRRRVINVWWEDAKAYVAWLSRRTGKNYRLLTEAEREYVTRAGTQTPFWWGATISTAQANYDGKFGYPRAARGGGAFRRQTVPVDSFHPNPWGLYQVHGNVYEWVEDCWHDDYAGAPADGSARVTPDCARRVMRGGSYNFAPWHLRAAARGQIAAVALRREAWWASACASPDRCSGANACPGEVGTGRRQGHAPPKNRLRRVVQELQIGGPRRIASGPAH